MQIRFGTGAFGIVSMIAVGVYSIPLVAPKFMKQFYEKEGEEAPPELVAHVKKIARLMGVMPARSENIKVFLTRGLHSVTFGAPYLPSGAYVGLPRQFLWEGVEDAKKSPVYKKGKLVDWDTDFGDRLANCLTPSGSQINFRIAHELAHITSKHHFYLAIVPPMLLFTFWVVTKFVTPFLCARFGFQITSANLAAMIIWIFFFLNQMSRSRHQFELEADKVAAEVGRGFAEGGIELFFRQRQISALLGDESYERSSTHPSAIERQRELQKIMVEKYQYNFD